MKRVGITGGIGSGKSSVCALFAALGVSVYDSDRRAKELMNGDIEIMKAVTALFGPQAYDGNLLNNAFIASKVFNDKILLASLNGIVHPALALDFEAWAISHSDFAYVIMESAILFESGFDRLVDKIVTVSAPEELRIERVVSRDGASRRSVMDRIANQLTDEEREARADYVIHNDGSTAELATKVKELDKKLRQ